MITASSTLDKKALDANANIVARNYWKDRLSGFEVNTWFNDQVGLSGAHDQRVCRTLQMDAPPRLYGLLHGMAGSDKAKHLLLLSVLGILAQKYSGIPDVVVLTPIYDNLLSPDSVNRMLPVRMKDFHQSSFITFVTEVKAHFIKDTQQGDYPLARMLGRDTGAVKNSVQVAMLVEGIQHADALEQVQPDLLFSFQVNAQLSVSILYDNAKFENAYISQVANLYFSLLEKLILHKETPISSIELIPEDEKNRILTDFNDTARSFPRDKTIMDLFLEQARRDPERVAIRYKDQDLTYQQLDMLSNRVANSIAKLAQKRRVVVGVLLDRSIDLIPAIFGILKAGCVYLPLTRSYPQERIRYALRNSAAGILLIRREHFDLFQDEFTCLDVAAMPDVDTAINLAAPEDPAYIIYTSGSTGRPKGVVIRHRSVVNRLWWMQRKYLLQQEDIILQKTPIVFDVSVWELFWWSFVGAKLVLAEPGAEKDPGEMSRVMREENITVLHFVPSMLRSFLGFIQDSPAGALPAKIRYVFTSGEELSLTDAELFLKTFHNTELHNLYGPTEATVDVSYYEVSAATLRRRIPIGKPIDNTQLLVLNAERQLQPIGVPGELYIGGVNLADGYVNQVELTSNRFVKDPFHDGMLYRTGDLARWCADGNIEFLGRIDNQVKIRGNRIETGEIEYAIEAYEGVNKAIVLPKDSARSGLHLVAYLVTATGFSETALRELLSRKLPDYMMPSYFILIDEIPVTVNGKADRAKLLSLKRSDSTRYAAPGSDTEKALCAIWENTLDGKRVGIDDNFFVIGGDSILAIRLLSTINTHFSIQIPLADIYSHATVRLLAPRVQEMAALGQRGEEDHQGLPQVSISDLDLPDASNISDVFPMSDIEKGMCYHYLNSGEDVLYFEQNVIDILYAEFDEQKLRHAVSLLMEKHEILRTSFELESFLSIVHERVEPNITSHDISHLGMQAQREWVKEYLAKSKNEQFVLASAPLWRMHVLKLSAQYHVLVIELAHAILDGWSYASFVTELNNTYIELTGNPHYRPGLLKCTYKDFVVEELRSKNDPDIRQYWKQELENYQRLMLPPAGGEVRYGSETLVYDSEKVKLLVDIAAGYNTNLKHMFFGAFVYSLAMLTEQSDILIGLVSFNRPVKEDGEKVLGCFINMVPVRMKLRRDTTWPAYLTAVEKKLAELKRYDKITLLEILKISGQLGRSTPLFDVQFNFVNFQGVTELRTQVAPASGDTERLGLNNYLREETRLDFNVDLTENRCVITSEYSTSYIDRHNVLRLHDYFDAVIRQIIETPNAVPDNLALFTAGERDRILNEFSVQGNAGKSAENTCVYILNDRGQLQPVGVRGEVWISDTPEYGSSSDAVKGLVDDPFIPSRRMYKTGDLGRWLEDGTLELAGRSQDAEEAFSHAVDKAPESVAMNEDHPSMPNDTTREIADLWAEILEFQPGERISLHTDFFEAGGHSISAIALVTKINRKYGLHVEVKTLYACSRFHEFVTFVIREMANTTTVVI